jgi:hypothetical protein
VISIDVDLHLGLLAGPVRIYRVGAVHRRMGHAELVRQRPGHVVLAHEFDPQAQLLRPHRRQANARLRLSLGRRCPHPLVGEHDRAVVRRVPREPPEHRTHAAARRPPRLRERLHPRHHGRLQQRRGPTARDQLREHLE